MIRFKLALKTGFSKRLNLLQRWAFP
ncbi:hypothetical protein Godav_016504 [Gossypium davidsonii]|uniref:Uncharacterized protein n=1 Tax=Gossypium davidsonii TaxID=34287 RepID=A0A7J8RSA5_GOSDV|nr:hypothetical protein [Gossypium davidsonii]